ncbi:hypothetical protein HDU96_010261 [Phlyctochytrium bullatum]|nr:hypothetical protein HDU96_010261 [Phlyctochytrium bullatum]
MTTAALMQVGAKESERDQELVDGGELDREPVADLLKLHLNNVERYERSEIVDREIGNETAEAERGVGGSDGLADVSAEGKEDTAEDDRRASDMNHIGRKGADEGTATVKLHLETLAAQLFGKKAR